MKNLKQLKYLYTILFIILFSTLNFAQYTSTHTGAEIDAGVRPYKVYTALLTQSGTNAPVATVLENTLGGTVVWSRPWGSGYYSGTLNGAFIVGKTFVVCQELFKNGSLPELISVQRTDNSLIISNNTGIEMEFWTNRYLGTGVTGGTGIENVFPIEIRVYQ